MFCTSFALDKRKYKMPFDSKSLSLEKHQAKRFVNLSFRYNLFKKITIEATFHLKLVFF